MNITNESTAERRAAQNTPPRREAMFPRSPLPVRKDRVPETVLNQAAFDTERKHFSVLRCSNAQGEFLRITESAIGFDRRATIIVPMAGAEAFLKAIATVCPTT